MRVTDTVLYTEVITNKINPETNQKKQVVYVKNEKTGKLERKVIKTKWENPEDAEAPAGGTAFEEGKLPSLDDIKGSGSIKQISHDIVSFARNSTATNDKERNTIKMMILKSRFTGLTGIVNGACYDYDTGRLLYAEGHSDQEDSFTTIDS